MQSTQLTLSEVASDLADMSKTGGRRTPVARRHTRRPRSEINRQPIEAATLPDALLKLRTVAAVTGLSSATIYRRLAAGDFPEPVRLGQRCTRWKSASIQLWLAAQVPSASPAAGVAK